MKIKRTGLQEKPLFYGLADATRIEIEPSDIANEGQGIEICVRGFVGDTSTDAEHTTHVLVEKWNDETRIAVWNCSQEPRVFKLVPAEVTCGHTACKLHYSDTGDPRCVLERELEYGHPIVVRDDRTGQQMHGTVQDVRPDHYEVKYDHGDVGEAWWDNDAGEFANCNYEED